MARNGGEGQLTPTETQSVGQQRFCSRVWTAGAGATRPGSREAESDGTRQVFVGTFEHSLDDKGRVVLPSTFRSHLADKGFISQLDDCLGLWTEDGFTEVATRLTQKVRDGLAPQDAMRAFSSAAAEVRPDRQGRVTIPQRLRTAPDWSARSSSSAHRPHRDLGCVRWQEIEHDGGPEPDRSRPGSRSLSGLRTNRNHEGKGESRGTKTHTDGAEAPRSSAAPWAARWKAPTPPASHLARSGRNPDVRPPAGGLPMSEGSATNQSGGKDRRHGSGNPVSLTSPVWSERSPNSSHRCRWGTDRRHARRRGPRRALLAAHRTSSSLGIDQDDDALAAAATALAVLRCPGSARARRGSISSPRSIARSTADRRSRAPCSSTSGVSSPQLDRAERGFSYRNDGAARHAHGSLDRPTAADVVNELRRRRTGRRAPRPYGDERFASRIAPPSSAARPVSTTAELAEIVRNAIPAPARRTRRPPRASARSRPSASRSTTSSRSSPRRSTRPSTCWLRAAGRRAGVPLGRGPHREGAVPPRRDRRLHVPAGPALRCGAERHGAAAQAGRRETRPPPRSRRTRVLRARGCGSREVGRGMMMPRQSPAHRAGTSPAPPNPNGRPFVWSSPKRDRIRPARVGTDRGRAPVRRLVRSGRLPDRADPCARSAGRSEQWCREQTELDQQLKLQLADLQSPEHIAQVAR